MAISKEKRFCKDEFNVQYNIHKTVLIKAPKQIVEYIIPDTVSEIADRAFEECYFLKSVTLPNSLIKIGKKAFRDCCALEFINIPNSVSEIAFNAFKGCDCLELYNENKTLLVTVPRNVEEYIIPDTVIEIADGAFKDCCSLKSVIMPNSITTIGGSAFWCCTSLQSVTMPNSITTIETGAFWCCTSLQSVTVSNSLVKIGDSAFYRCSSLISINIPDTLCEIGMNALQTLSLELELYNESKTILFSVPKNIKEYIIPDSVVTIWENAFWSCTALQSLEIPNSVTKIGLDAFRYCTSLELYSKDKTVLFSVPRNKKEYIIPDTVVEIREGAFENSSIEKLIIPESVTTIRRYAFLECTALHSIIIPDSIIEIAFGAFWYCTSLQDLTLPDTFTLYDPAFFASSSLVLYNRNKTILLYSFKQEASFIIPDTVIEIKKDAFDWNANYLKSVTIPNGVIKINEDLFKYCEILEELYIHYLESNTIVKFDCNCENISEVFNKNRLAIQ